MLTLFNINTYINIIYNITLCIFFPCMNVYIYIINSILHICYNPKTK